MPKFESKEQRDKYFDALSARDHAQAEIDKNEAKGRNPGGWTRERDEAEAEMRAHGG